MLKAAVERALSEHGLSPEESVLIACSGGVDSTALAHVSVDLLGAGRVTLGHVDHGVRPDSAEDARFVAELAQALGARFLARHLPPGSADEARLREERYTALESERVEAGAKWILLGHTADDQAETVLLGLLRATRLYALAGMPRLRGALLRPMLDVPRHEVITYARRHRLAWRDDPTNREPAYVRNRVRKELLPLLETRYRSGIRDRLWALAAEVAQLAPELRAGPAARVERWVAAQAQGLAQKSTGPVEQENRAAELTVPQDCEPSLASPSPTTKTRPTTNATPFGLCVERRPWTGGPLPDGKRAAVFDAAVLPRPVIRPPRPGDRIQPLGMTGTRKIQDVLVDAKVPRDARAAYPVLATPDGDVVWVPGILRSSLAPVQAGTREVWWFEAEAAP